jgi:hypothetical protein
LIFRYMYIVVLAVSPLQQTSQCISSFAFCSYFVLNY